MLVDPILHVEVGLEHIAVPPINWRNAQEQLQQILVSHEESPAEGGRFLLATNTECIYEGCPCFLRRIHIEYIISREREGWSYHIAVWLQHTPYAYDYDVSEMRPFIHLT